MTSFLELHASGTFLLVNVHDAGAARIAEAAGAVALGTTSSGHAYTLARPDGVGAISRLEAMRRAEAICQAVDVPVSIDAENGWGHTPEEVAQAVRDLHEIGAAGASFEDWSSDTEIGLYESALAVDRMSAAVEAAKSLPEPFVICARAEAFLYGEPRLEDVLPRLQAFAQAGADCVYAPGPRDPAILRRLVAESGAPVNALIGVGSHLTMSDARGLGIRRVSVGGSLYRATMASYERLVRQLVETGDFTSDPAPIPTADIESLFRRAPTDGSKRVR